MLRLGAIFVHSHFQPFHTLPIAFTLFLYFSHLICRTILLPLPQRGEQETYLSGQNALSIIKTRTQYRQRTYTVFIRTLVYTGRTHT